VPTVHALNRNGGAWTPDLRPHRLDPDEAGVTAPTPLVRATRPPRLGRYLATARASIGCAPFSRGYMAGMNEVYTGISDFHRRGPYAAHVTAYRSAGDAPISLLTSAKPAGTYTFPPTIDLILGLAIRGVHQAEYDFGAGRWRGRTLPGNFALLAPGVGASVTSTNVGKCLTSAETLLLAVPAAALQPTLAGVRAGASWADFGRLHAAPFRDPFLETLCRQFWDEAVEGNPHGCQSASEGGSSANLMVPRLVMRHEAHGREADRAWRARNPDV